MTRYAYLRFDVSSISNFSAGTLASIDLYVVNAGTRSDGGTPTYTLYALNDVAASPDSMAGEAAWSANMAWADRPDGTSLYPGNVYGSAVSTVSDAADASVISFDITSNMPDLLNADSNGEITFLIESSANAVQTEFASLSNSNSYAVPSLSMSPLKSTMFTVGPDGVNDTLSGSGAVTEDGVFIVDLTGAGTTTGNAWQLVDLETQHVTYGTNFTVESTLGSFVEYADTWTIREHDTTYVYSEDTGMLTAYESAAYWMEGKVGIGWWFVPTNKSKITGLDVDHLVANVKTVPGVSYVIFNLSNTYNSYTAPHSVLTALDPEFTPNNDRDLFLETATKFKAEGYRVICYIACQGPAMLKHGAQYSFDAEKVDGVWTSDAMDSWSNYVQGVYGDTTDDTYKQAFAEIVVDEWAARYGTLIDGWWFDNGSKSMNAPLLHEVVTAHNPNTICTFNGSDQNQDYLTGHPNTGVPHSDDSNETKLLLPIEASYAAGDNGYIASGNTMALGHMFMGAQENWTSGAITFTVEKAADWLYRCTQANGAWTWSCDIYSGISELRPDVVELMQDVYAKVEELKAANPPPDIENPVWYAMDDRIGTTVADSSVNGFDGTVVDGAWVSGISGSALDFNGTSSSVTLPPAAFDGICATDEITVSAWVNGANGAVIRAGDEAGRVVNVVFNSNGNLYWDAGNSGTASYDRIFKAVDPALHTGAWSHWVFTKSASAGTMAIYRNGVLWHSGTGKTRTMNSISEAYIGSAGGNSYFDGSIDNVHLYAEALDAADVANLYRNMLIANPPEVEADMTITNENMMVQFSGIPGETYRLEYLDDLMSSNEWSVVTDLVSLATAPAEVFAPATNSAGFYRLRWVQ